MAFAAARLLKDKQQKEQQLDIKKVDTVLFYYENYDIALAMSSSRADPVLGHCPGWGYLNI